MLARASLINLLDKLLDSRKKERLISQPIETS